MDIASCVLGQSYQKVRQFDIGLRRCDAESTEGHSCRIQPGLNQQVCKFYASGQCRFGGSCRYSHSAIPALKQGGRNNESGSQWIERASSTKQLGMDLARVLYGEAGCRLLVVGDADLSFSAHVAETTTAELLATCQEQCDLLFSRRVGLQK